MPPFSREGQALARRLGKDPIQVALADVLAQKGGVVPLIGPATLSEHTDRLTDDNDRAAIGATG